MGDSEDGRGGGCETGAGEATETFNFTPINAMRSLENVELSAEREGGMGKRARRRFCRQCASSTRMSSSARPAVSTGISTSPPRLG